VLQRDRYCVRERHVAQQALLCLVLLLTSLNVYAPTNWTAGTGDWFANANWTAGVPNSTTNAILDNGGMPHVSARAARQPSMNSLGRNS
jgi:hypothetical protein